MSTTLPTTLFQDVGLHVQSLLLKLTLCFCAVWELQHVLINPKLFWGCSCLQCVITCNRQIQKRKAWEIWSFSVMSGRQRVDTWGTVPNDETRSLLLFCNVSPRLRVFGSEHQYCSSFMAPGMGNRHYYDQAPPPVCLLSVYLTSLHVMNSHRPPLSVFAYCKQSKFHVGTRVIIHCMCA